MIEDNLIIQWWWSQMVSNEECAVFRYCFARFIGFESIDRVSRQCTGWCKSVFCWEDFSVTSVLLTMSFLQPFPNKLVRKSCGHFQFWQSLVTHSKNFCILGKEKYVIVLVCLYSENFSFTGSNATWQQIYR